MDINNLCDGLREKLEEIGIAAGDTVYVASDIRYLIYSTTNKFGADQIDSALDILTNTLQEVVGDEGTILFPVFSWDFCRGKGFDYYKTQGEVGTYSNWILNNRKDFRRTQHPLYSFMVWGKKQDMFCNMSNQDAWGVASPFYYLLRNEGKQLEFNVESYKGLTFIHCIEQWVKVPYRHYKYFYGKYTDANGDTEIRTYSMYVRDLDVYEHTKTTHQYLIEHGAAVATEWDGNKLTVVDIAKCYDVVKEDIINNDGINNLSFKDYEFHYDTQQTIPYEVRNIPVE
ncbi:MAG: AAC(3) family N-acetyltransferase [Lachnospiraceae bacterium]|nr:AAC(3) family N-acetyltransferase [Lachnospiraceae bacterium]